jgi:DNA-binding XRE family transcriptional regulator
MRMKSFDVIFRPRGQLLGPGAKKRSGVGVRLVNIAKSGDQRRKPGTKIMITAAQCRSARTLLSWSVNKLATAASVAETAIHDFELERHRPDMPTLDAIQRAFEEVGIVFLAGDDVQLRSAVAPSK